jgi:hypothetical protein
LASQKTKFILLLQAHRYPIPIYNLISMTTMGMITIVPPSPRTFEFLDTFSANYLRVIKRTGKKNIRCFPNCSEAGHNAEGVSIYSSYFI